MARVFQLLSIPRHRRTVASLMKETIRYEFDRAIPDRDQVERSDPPFAHAGERTIRQFLLLAGFVT